VETPEKQIRHSTAAIASAWVRRVFTHQEDDANENRGHITKIIITQHLNEASAR
jgi:hypothetical protein